MLWGLGKSTNMANFAALVNAGYSAVKNADTSIKVIVHLSSGNNNNLYRKIFDGLKANNANWDIIGMSLYPTTTNWATVNNQCLTNMNDMVTRYGKQVIIAEAGMDVSYPLVCDSFLTDLVLKVKAVKNNCGLGVFYWEPETYKWTSYFKGAFDSSGKPTTALKAFSNGILDLGIAPIPSFPNKAALSQTVYGSRTFTNPSLADTVIKPWKISNAYTLEVVAKVNSSIGRGLDIEARNGLLKGFRLSLDSSLLYYSSNLNVIPSLGTSVKGQYQTIRIAVQNDTAYIYQNGKYKTCNPISTIKDLIVDTNTETDSVNNAALGTNLISNWSGSGATGSNSKPSNFGWLYSYSPPGIFNTANSTTNVRYIDVTANSNTHIYNGNNYVGRVMFIRWDGGTTSYQNATYILPVTLEANTLYNFSWLYAFINNGIAPYNITVGVGTSVNTADRYAQKTFTASPTPKLLQYGNLSFVSLSTSGTYYITITSSNSTIFSIAELSLNKLTPTARFIFGKDYANGAVNIDILSISYDDGAFSPLNAWTGAKSSEWNDINNWSYRIVPSNTDDLIIGTSTPNAPTLNGSYSVGLGKTLTINGSGTLNISVEGILSVDGTVDFGGNPVTVLSNSNGSGIIINNGKIINAKNVILQQWITGQRGYRIMSNPFSTELIPSIIGAANGITISGSNDVKTYDFASNIWIGSVNSIPANSPYSVFIRGLASEVNGINYTGGPTAFAYSVAGTLNENNVVLKQNNSSANDWTIAGNPFVAPVYSSALTGGVLGLPYYIYSMEQNSSGKRIKAGGWVAASSNSNSTTTIPMMGVVAYKAGTSAPSSFTVASSAIDTTKSHSLSMVLFGASNEIKQIELQLNKEGNYQDKLYVRYDPNSTSIGSEKMDLQKLYNDFTNIYTISSDKLHLSVDSRKNIETSVPIGIKAPIGNYSFSFANYNFPNATNLYLLDKWLNKKTNLGVGLAYSFAISSDSATQGDSRFEIVSDNSSISETISDAAFIVKVLGNIVNHTLRIMASGAKGSLQITITDIQGKMISKVTTKDEIVTLNLNNSSGLYLVKVTDGITSIVKKVVIY